MILQHHAAGFAWQLNVVAVKAGGRVWLSRALSDKYTRVLQPLVSPARLLQQYGLCGPGVGLAFVRCQPDAPAGL